MVRKIKVSPGIGTASLLIQHSELHTSDIFVDKPELILILQGHSTLRHGLQETAIQSGEMLAVIPTEQSPCAINNSFPNTIASHFLSFLCILKAS